MSLSRSASGRCRRANANGDRPAVHRVDLITGQVTGPASSPDADINPATAVVARFGPGDWRGHGSGNVIQYTYATCRPTCTSGARHQHRRGRASSGRQREPWTDLWFYSNPVFVHVR